MQANLHTVVLDNEWAHVGISLQVFAEALGIDVIYAPLKNPEYKSIGERAFRTLNEECLHRLPGGIPHKPTEMTALELEPRADQLFTIEEIGERIWLFFITIYHMERHQGIDIQPARAWYRGVKRGEWQTVDDMNAASKFLGETKRRTLSATGVDLDGHEFHDQKAVTSLLDSMLRYTAGRRRREKRLSTGTVPVVVTKDPATCEYIHVRDLSSKRNVKLFNKDRRFSEGCSWQLAKAVKDAALRENQAFQTDEEKWEARRVYEASLVPAILASPLPTQRKLLRNKRKKPALALGGTIQTVEVEPSVSGMNSAAIPNSMPARNREDDRRPPKGPRRGGAKAARTSLTNKQKTGSKPAKKTVARSPAKAPALIRNFSTQIDESLPDEMARALLAALAADLD